MLKPRYAVLRQNVNSLISLTSFKNPDESERFSDYDSVASTTTSIGSSLYNYTYENGRRYASYKDDKSYLLPNDETEKDRLDLTHHLFCLTLDGELCLTKLDNPQRILDVGSK